LVGELEAGESAEIAKLDELQLVDPAVNCDDQSRRASQTGKARSSPSRSRGMRPARAVRRHGVRILVSPGKCSVPNPNSRRWFFHPQVALDSPGRDARICRPDCTGQTATIEDDPVSLESGAARSIASPIGTLLADPDTRPLPRQRNANARMPRSSRPESAGLGHGPPHARYDRGRPGVERRRHALPCQSFRHARHWRKAKKSADVQHFA